MLARVAEIERATGEERLRQSAAAEAERAEVAMLRHSYRDAAALYRKAVESLLQPDTVGWADYLNEAGSALRQQGLERGDNPALQEAIATHEKVLAEIDRATLPDLWADTQNRIGIAASHLGEREAGTDRLERAVEAYNAALEERTRERMPL